MGFGEENETLFQKNIQVLLCLKEMEIENEYKMRKSLKIKSWEEGGNW